MGEAVALMDEKEKRKEETVVKKKEEGEKRAKAVEIRDDSMKRMGEKRKNGVEATISWTHTCGERIA